MAYCLGRPEHFNFEVAKEDHKIYYFFTSKKIGFYQRLDQLGTNIDIECQGQK